MQRATTTTYRHSYKAKIVHEVNLQSIVGTTLYALT